MRRRRGLTQAELAALASVTQQTVSLLERGKADGSTLRTIQKVAGPLGITGDLVLRWKGPELDRLMDARHARLVKAVVSRLGPDWSVVAEYTFNHSRRVGCRAFAPPSPGRGILIRLLPRICRGGEIGRRPCRPLRARTWRSTPRMPSWPFRPERLACSPGPAAVDPRNGGRGVAADQRRTDWNKRHAAGDFEGIGPNPTLVAAASGLVPGRALELAAGSGTNAVWLASQGWQTTAVDWSPVGLANGRAKADAARLQVEWLERNLLTWSPPARAYDLVVIVYLHLPPEERRSVYAHAAAAVGPGGRMLIVGHDRLNETEGAGGPPDPTRLFTADEIGRELATADPGLTVERAEVVRRVPLSGRAPIDALLVLRRGDERKSYRSGKRKMLPWLY